MQSVVLSVFLMGSAFNLAMMAIMTDLIAVNRQLLEKLGYRQQFVETKLGNPETSE